MTRVRQVTDWSLWLAALLGVLVVAGAPLWQSDPPAPRHEYVLRSGPVPTADGALLAVGLRWQADTDRQAAELQRILAEVVLAVTARLEEPTDRYASAALEGGLLRTLRAAPDLPPEVDPVAIGIEYLGPDPASGSPPAP